MKKKLGLVFICGIILFGVCGCGDNSSVEYYCESEEHELLGSTCFVKEKVSMSYSYQCKNGSEVNGALKKCPDGNLPSMVGYCSQGYEENGYCIIEKSYNALQR